MEDLLHLWNEAIRAADPSEGVRNKLEKVLEGNEVYSQVLVVGAGKAVVGMALVALKLLKAKLSVPMQGFLVTKYGHVTIKERASLQAFGVHVMEADHPLPNEAGVEAATAILNMVAAHARRDVLVVNLVSGGGSSLACLPNPGISLKDLRSVVAKLLSCGATINDINIVRRHLTRYHGGGLSRCSFPATVHSFIVSDVIGDCISTIAGGPTAADSSSIIDCNEILASIDNTIDMSAIMETLKPSDKLLSTSHNHIVASNSLALEAARIAALSLAYTPLVMSRSIHGEAREVAKVLCSIAMDFAKGPMCLIFGGETTVTLGHEHGNGGRNQELALSAAVELFGCEGMSLLAAGTDGQDGPCDAAGAIVTCDLITSKKQLKQAKEYLKNHDSYGFFQSSQVNKLHHLITGPTGTNVMDICIILCQKQYSS